MKPCLLCCFIVLFVGLLRAEPEKPPSEKIVGQPAASPPAPTAEEELASLLRIGANKLAAQDWQSAEIAFCQVIDAKTTPAQYIEALSGLARTYRLKGDLTKACAIYERLIKDYPEATSLPTVYLELGRSLRALGAYRMALSRFYSVINSTLKLTTEGAGNYRQLARTAQFEIAETYFQSGDYDQAFRFFTKLNLLDLAPADRARVAFKSAYSLCLEKDHEKAAVALRNFIAQNPDAPDSPQALYLLSIELSRLGREQESLATVLDLLRVEKKRTQSAPQTWSYWQRQTGNQLANEFYEQGDISSSLEIYQNMLKLDSTPAWRLPILYQVGLCYERLRQAPLARASYQSILDTLKQTSANPGTSENFDDLVTMVNWRLKSLDWLETTDRQLSVLFPPTHPTASP